MLANFVRQDGINSKTARLSTCFVILISIVASVVCPLIWSQTNDVDQKGLPPDGVFEHGDIDTVNLQNGNLHISIPLISLKQRGGSTVSWNLVYDTQAWEKLWIPNNCGSRICTPTGEYAVLANPSVSSGWRVLSSLAWTVTSTRTSVICATTGQPYTQITNWAIKDPEGGQHPTSLRQEVGTTCQGQTLAGPTLDGSGLTYNITTNTIHAKNGSSILGPTEDANGNMMSETLDTVGRTPISVSVGPTITYTAPSGRTITGPQYTKYTSEDSNGNPQVYEVDYQAVDEISDICASTFSVSGTCTEGGGQTLVYKQLLLPDGRAYVFTYTNNTPGDLSRVDLPTGASIAYTYGDFYQTQFGGEGQQPNSTGGRSIATRTVTVGGVSNRWTYKIAQGTSSVTDPLGNSQSHTFVQVNSGTGSQMRTSSNFYEAQVVYKGSSGTLRTVNTDYEADADYVTNVAINVRPIRKTTILDNGQQSKVETDYETFTYPCQTCDTSSGSGIGIATRLNATAVRQYDYGTNAPGALLKTTNYSYLHSSNSTYVGLNIVDKATSVTVYDGSGNMMSQTINEFDNYNHSNQAMTASSAMQHDSSFGTNYTTRGNMTAVSRWRNTDGAFLTSSFQYDDAGNILSTVAPLGDKTSCSFVDSWSNSHCVPSGNTAAFPTKVTNALGQSTTAQYDPCTGLIGNSTDPNVRTTSYIYDFANRAKQILHPDGGAETFCYSDDPNGACYSPSVLSSTAADTVTTTKTLYDGLGRVVQTQLLSDLAGVDKVDTTYDSVGRVQSMSNPYRSTGEPTYGITSYLYDGLGRRTYQCQPDNSSLSSAICSPQHSYRQWTYAGNVVTQRDEQGDTWGLTSDALNRLTNVQEPTGASTTYIYSALGNLNSITQSGVSGETPRGRSFGYDSLSQLITSSNPESGLACYGTWSGGSVGSGTCQNGYDGNGNLLARTDARGITTRYAYDALNRLTKKSYSDGVTPTSLYVYDSNSIFFNSTHTYTTSNVVGRLSVICVDIPGACQSMTAYSYDPMGRIIETLSNTPSFPTTGTVYAVSAAYDLAGDRTSLTNSTGRTFNYSYDAAGRLQTTSNTVSLNGTPVTTSMVNSMTYFPSGQPQTMTTDTGSATITGTWGVDNRLRVTSYQNLSSANLVGANYGYSLTYTPNSNVLTDAETVTPLTGAVSWSWNFGYDSLNRLTSAQSGGAVQLGCVWTYDSFGNRLNQQPSGSGLSCTTVSTPVNSNNQVNNPIYGYDAAGDVLTENGNTLTYDAEGRISAANGTTYTYGADGQRVSKTSAGVETDFIRDFDGTLLDTYVSGSYINQPQEMWIAGRHYGTWYVSVNNGVQNQGEGLSLTNWLGSEAMRSFVVSNGANTGVPTYAFLSLPFGDGQTTLIGGDHDDIHFTGKERDSESGLDYFGARYYASSLGRFMSPDWSAKIEPVPYSKLDDPQTLNLYSYVGNGPLNRADANGHAAAQVGVVAADLAELSPTGCELAGSIFECQAEAMAAGAMVWSTQDQQNYEAKLVESYATQSDQQAQQQNTNQQSRDALAAAAKSSVGSTAWAYDTPPCGNKCSKFVADTIHSIGADASFDLGGGKSRAPLAGEWANTKAKISGWRVLGADETPQPGDVAAVHIMNVHQGATGHVGIVALDPSGRLSAVAQGDHGLGYDHNFIHGYADVTYRRYTGGTQ